MNTPLLTVSQLVILLRQVIFEGLLNGAHDTDILVWSEKLQRWVLIDMP